MLWVIGVGILFPLFFQLDGGIYNDVYPIIDSKGMLTRLPLPISILTCFAAAILLIGNFHKVRPAVGMVLGTIAVGLISLWLGSDGVTAPQRKLIMIAQVVLPLAGLLLGQLVDDTDKVIAKAFLIVISIVVPLQLLATWWQGGMMLTHYLYLFSIYSHFQYVSLVFVGAYAYSLVSLWDEKKRWLVLLMAPMLLYVTASLSFLTIGAYLLVLFAFGFTKLAIYRRNLRVVAVVAVLVAVTLLGCLLYLAKMEGQRTFVEGEDGLFRSKFNSLVQGKMPLNVLERFHDWKLFGSGILESKKTLLLGHPQPMPREIKSSPHNWYVDMVYSFGLIALLPIAALMFYTAYSLWGQRKTLAPETWWLAAIVFYMVVIDSNLKVTLRQPYPGIFTYFMWGMLLSRLQFPAAGSLGASRQP